MGDLGTSPHQSAIEAVDLYPNDANVGVVYYDNMSLDVPPLFLEVDRDSSGLSLVNNTGVDLDILGYSITSAAGALDQGGWTPISGNYDAPSNGGDGSVDSDDPWTILTAAGSHTDLSESELAGGNGGVLGASIDFGSAWLKSPTEDLRMELLLASGKRSPVVVNYVGNDGEPYAVGDLNFDGDINEFDWPMFRSGSFADLSGLSVLEAYYRGDLNGDGANDLTDFDVFKTEFDGANGVGAFDAMIAAVPEPATWVLLAMGAFLMIGKRYRQWLALVCLVALFVAVTSGPASADVLPGTGTNYALAGVATQSTTGAGRPAENGVNGSFREQGTHTDGAATDPWWQVVFNDGNQDIDYIQLYNRTDCCQARLRDITIRIRDAADTTDLLVSPVLNPGNVNGGQMTLDWDVLAANGGVPVNGGIVRVERASDPNSTADDANVLTLNEVLGLGTDVVRVRPNIAVGSPAIQSSDYSATAGGAALAVDGNINGNWGSGSTTHTAASDENPYWQVDLGVVSQIDGITLWNRMDCCWPRFSDLTIDVLADDGTVVHSSGLLNPGDVDGGPQLLTDNVLGQGVTGRFVRVTRTTGGAEPFLSLAEVQVFGEKAQMTLEVNTTTGAVTLKNDSFAAFDIDGYAIESEANALDPAGWTSLEQQDLPDFPAGTGTGTGWEESGGSGTAALAELFLQDSSAFATGASVSLGNAFNPAVFGSGQDGDLSLTIHTAGGAQLEAAIEYVSTSVLLGDVNLDGEVNGLDVDPFVDRLLNGPDQAEADMNQDGTVNGLDVDPFVAAIVGGGVQAVPEPSTLALVGLAGLALVLRISRGGNLMKRSRYLSLLVAGLLVTLVGSTAQADVTLDRNYLFGDNTGISAQNENATAGARIGNGAGGVTFDTVSVTNNPTADSDAQNLSPTGTPGPNYVSVTTGTFARTSADGDPTPPASGDLGAEFSGSGEYLRGARLGAPSTAAGTIGYGEVELGSPWNPNDYTGIVNRGFQLWVYPTSSAAAQTVVMDTNQHGVRISADGNWSMRYNNSDVDSAAAIATNQWSHVMVVRQTTGSRLYVDGVAVAAAGGNYGDDNASLVLGSNTEFDVDGNFVGGTEEYFSGVLDNLEMFVTGTSTGANPEDFGTFDLATDNQYVAGVVGGLPDGDVDMDGSLNQEADVDAFVAGWLNENLVNNIRVGDLNSRGAGDLNYDGITDLSDAFLLHEALAAQGGGLDFSALTAAVPEPSTLLLLSLAVVIGLLWRRR